MGGSGGGGGGYTQATTYSTNLPEYARPYYERMMERAEAESNQPYVGYRNPRLAGFAPDQTAGFGITRNIAAQGTPQTEAAGRVAAGAAARGFSASDYQANPIQQSSFGSQQAEQYMSPYMQQVIERQKSAAVQDYQEGRPSRETQAIKSGAFGGYRQAIQEGVAERGLSRQLSDIEAQGRQRAYEQAQGQFERDRAASIQAQGLTEQQRLQAAQYGLSGAGLGLQGAQTMGQLEAMEQGLGMQQAEALQRQGATQQNLQQQALDISYQDFLNQRDYERNRINFMSNILRGTPITPETASRQYANPNPLTQMAGLGIAGLGAYNQLSR
jgi:hypothetical protein